MRQFFKFVFASMVGVLISSLILVGIFLASIAVLISSSKDRVDVKDNTILHINLNLPITERSSGSPLDDLDFGPFKGERKLGLNDILKSIKSAKDDSNIKGIYLDVNYMMTGFATIEEIRNALLDFKKSGKFIIAYSEVYTQGAYYLASVANKVYLNPQGILELKGLSSEIMFYKGALDKLDIEAQVIKVGTFKSAVEPYVLDKMSDANRLQTTALLGSLYNHLTLGIAQSRKIPQDSVIAIANGLKSRSPQDALTYKLVDGLKYKDQILDELKEKTGIAKDKNLNTVSISDYAKTVESKNSASDKIAVIYANGDINSGEGDENSIGSEGISRALRKARLNDKIKAIVLRVNSPGGSALASDIIWREVLLAKKVKPVIVSMGDYAASGGYYISCAANEIFAEPTTITGSIGVFAIIPNMKGFFNNKLGITFDGVKTGEFADLGNVSRPLNNAEKMILQNEVNRTYNDFTKRVAEGRNLSQTYVDSIGQGRVWTGEQAVKLKLVDKLGHLDDAIAEAARKANLREYKTVSYPEIKDGLMGLLDNSDEKIKTYLVKQELGQSYQYYQKIKEVSSMTGLQAKLPYEINIQ
nr:signal peptide peptidase SppA [uncultured Pedobacter sp.]